VVVVVGRSMCMQGVGKVTDYMAMLNINGAHDGSFDRETGRSGGGGRAGGRASERRCRFVRRDMYMYMAWLSGFGLGPFGVKAPAFLFICLFV
jgi:hypothetical protein